MDAFYIGSNQESEKMETETVLQFGSGRFLRAFTDLFVHQANQAGQNVGGVVVVQSTARARADALKTQAGRYHVLIRGRWRGEIVDETIEVQSVRRALAAQTQWPEVIAFARSPELRWIVSNTTETGLALDPADADEQTPPRSFPAKLLSVLKARHAARLPGLTILPCELLETNADRLRALVLEQAQTWNAPDALLAWLTTECVWANTLVDRIVTDGPPDHPLAATDQLLTMAEPFALWAIENQDGRVRLFDHEAIQLTPNVQPFTLRKVRILNGAHTALITQAIPRGFTTVREALADSEIAAWLHGLLFEEIVPTMVGRVEDAEGFAQQVLERFTNPFLHHRLSDIALYHETKVKIRLEPTRAEFIQKFGHAPQRLTAAIESPL